MCVVEVPSKDLSHFTIIVIYEYHNGGGEGSTGQGVSRNQLGYPSTDQGMPEMGEFIAPLTGANEAGQQPLDAALLVVGETFVGGMIDVLLGHLGRAQELVGEVGAGLDVLAEATPLVLRDDFPAVDTEGRSRPQVPVEFPPLTRFSQTIVPRTGQAVTGDMGRFLLELSAVTVMMGLISACQQRWPYGGGKDSCVNPSAC